MSKAKERALFAEIEKSNIKLAETDLELREKEFTIDEMRSEADSMISTIDGLELKIEELEDKVKEALSSEWSNGSFLNALSFSRLADECIYNTSPIIVLTNATA